MRTLAFLVATICGAALTLAACAADRPAAAEREEGISVRDGSCVTEATRYLAFLRDGDCADVPGTGGLWSARPLFPDAPESVRRAACSYTWRSSSASASSVPASPDVRALEARNAEHLTRARPAESGCVETAPPPQAAATLRPPKDGGDVGPPTGVTGCDVCLQLHDRSVFVIRPASGPVLSTLLVSTSDGRALSFDLTPPDGAQAFSVTLPPLPADVRYVEDDINLIAPPL